jgi:hypothetical protein
MSGGFEPKMLYVARRWLGRGVIAALVGAALAGGCGSGGAGGDGVCSSGERWSSGEDEGSPLMNPGKACVSCHASDPEGEAPSLVIGGTVYPSSHEVDLCNGVDGAAPGDEVTVVITDASGASFELPVNAAGNFLRKGAAGSAAMPIRAKVVYQGKERVMSAAQDTGDCNSCHTEAGASGAPGRILLPE